MNAEITMGELIQRFPSAPLTLFSRFGVGSRDKLGFRPEQTLREVLSRYLVFDVDKVWRTIEETDRLQSALLIGSARLKSELGQTLLVDARGRDEFAMGGLPGARYLDSDLARELLSGPASRVVFYCRNGMFAQAAAQHFSSRGVNAAALAGGLLAWSEEIDDAFPVYGSDAKDRHGRLRILALRRRARILFKGPVLEAGLRLLPEIQPLPQVTIWRQRDFLFVERESQDDWVNFSAIFLRWLHGAQLQWREERIDQDSLERRILELLRGEVQERLNSHKGQVELVSLEDDVAHLRLGGGCQGCSSAALTVAEEISATLMQALPELFAVEDASEHEGVGLQPHH